jgi:hypothetical protein
MWYKIKNNPLSVQMQLKRKEPGKWIYRHHYLLNKKIEHMYYEGLTIFSIIQASENFRIHRRLILYTYRQLLLQMPWTASFPCRWRGFCSVSRLKQVLRCTPNNQRQFAFCWYASSTYDCSKLFGIRRKPHKRYMLVSKNTSCFQFSFSCGSE